jgi:hypothetical protein
MVHCLLGLFDVNMPLLYGEENNKAFEKLQEEILKQSDDQSIFAWRLYGGDCPQLLGPGPEYFRSCELVSARPTVRGIGNLAVYTPEGLVMNLMIASDVVASTQRDPFSCLIIFDCEIGFVPSRYPGIQVNYDNAAANVCFVVSPPLLSVAFSFSSNADIDF